MRLNKTWIFDIDGTLVVHAGITENGYDQFLPGVLESLKSIPPEDSIIFITARNESLRNKTEEFFIKNNVRFDIIVFGVGVGERILFNDKKPSGYLTAYAENLERNKGFDVSLIQRYSDNA